MSVSVWPGWWMSRSNSGFIAKKSLTWSSMDRCWAVTVTSGVKNADSSRALMSGATFTASGLVP